MFVLKGYNAKQSYQRVLQQTLDVDSVHKLLQIMITGLVNHRPAAADMTQCNTDLVYKMNWCYTKMVRPSRQIILTLYLIGRSLQKKIIKVG